MPMYRTMREMPEIDAIRRSETLRMARDCANLYEWRPGHADPRPARYFWLGYVALLGSILLVLL